VGEINIFLRALIGILQKVESNLKLIPNYSQQEATFLDLFISADAVHVSGGSSAHHQKHITLHTASGTVLLLAGMVDELESTIAANSIKFNLKFKFLDLNFVPKISLIFFIIFYILFS